MRIILFYFLTLFFFLSSKVLAFNALAQFTKFESANYQGRAAGLTLGHAIRPEFQPSLGVSDFNRDYNGGTTLHETTSSFGLVSLLHAGFYLETGLNVTPQAQIAALESGDMAAHWVNGSSDFGLKLGYSHYVNSKAGVLVPSLYQDFSDSFAGYFAAYIVRTSSYLSSGQAKLSYEFTDKHRLALNGAGGRTLEDAGVEADFKSLAFEYTFYFSRYSVGLSQNNYWSNLRGEKSYSLSVGYK